MLDQAVTISQEQRTVGSIPASPLNTTNMNSLRVPVGIHVVKSSFALMINET